VDETTNVRLKFFKETIKIEISGLVNLDEEERKKIARLAYLIDELKIDAKIIGDGKVINPSFWVVETSDKVCPSCQRPF